jgi:hypothetical protein
MSNEKLNEALAFVLEQVKDGTGFVKEQAPLVAQEIVRYELWSSVVFFVAAAAVALVTIFWARKKEWIVWEDLPGPKMFATIVVGVASVVAVQNGVHITKCVTAPRLVVLDYLRGVR